MAKLQRRDDGKCAAMSRTTGERCGNWAIKELAVCRFHGGAPVHAKQASARKQKEKQLTQKLEAKASAILAHEGLEPVEDPLRELGKLASAAQELMHSLGKRVNALQSVEEMDLKNSPQIKIEAEMYERAMDRTARILDMLVKHGYTERLVQIEEQEAMLVLGALNRVLSSLGLAPDLVTQAKALLAKEFRDMEPRPIQGIVVEPDS